MNFFFDLSKAEIIAPDLSVDVQGDVLHVVNSTPMVNCTEAVTSAVAEKAFAAFRQMVLLGIAHNLGVPIVRWHTEDDIPWLDRRCGLMPAEHPRGG